MQNKFFIAVFLVMLLCLILCVIQLARIEWSYEILNFLEEKNIIRLSPKQVAKQYIIALKRKDYKIAYSYLTPDSQERLSLGNFVSMNEKSMTIMDENKAWIYYEEVRVGMQIYECPGWWGYVLIKDKGKWKIVMRGGIPSFPFAYDNGYCTLNKD